MLSFTLNLIMKVKWRINAIIAFLCNWVHFLLDYKYFIIQNWILESICLLVLSVEHPELKQIQHKNIAETVIK